MERLSKVTVDQIPVYKAGATLDYIVGGDNAMVHSETRFCSRCTSTVYLAVTSIERLNSHPEAKIICIACFDEMPDADKSIMRPSDQDIQRDILGLGAGHGPRYG